MSGRPWRADIIVYVNTYIERGVAPPRPLEVLSLTEKIAEDNKAARVALTVTDLYIVF